MIWIWIGLGLFSVFLHLLFWAACRLGAEADKRMDAAFQKMMESCPQKDVDGSLREGAELQ